ncbi:hypothetical protein VNO77_28146 [Canavalia gladiata]|uniref:Uncharacterized protein n=1 Tax=Canavalia gladiata TaxID=3824 RepID=A0AAN9KVT8_CANGL
MIVESNSPAGAGGECSSRKWSTIISHSDHLGLPGVWYIANFEGGRHWGGLPLSLQIFCLSDSTVVKFSARDTGFSPET